MVNDLLKELYLKVTIPHMVWLRVGVLTIDKYQVSIVMVLESQNR